MLPSSSTTRPYEDHLRGRRLVLWVRAALLGIVAGLVAVFATAWWINPYRPDGTALREASHRQLGLPSCTFFEVTTVPCPACGMTTSFALLVRGDLLNSMKANWVGTLLASFCLAVIPWAALSAWRGRLLFLRSAERAALVVVLVLLSLMLTRWVVVVGLLLISGAAG